MAAALAPAEIEEDTMCPNGVQNIFVAYLAPPENTCKGIIRGVDVEVTEAQLRGRIVNHRNPGALEARRIKNTTAMVVLFEGMRVPNYVACGASIFRCTLYRRHTEWCRTCGKRSPTEDYRCDPKCTLCGGPHPTAAKECRHKFQVPCIVRRRRRQRRRRTEELQGFHRSRDSTNGGAICDCAPRQRHGAMKGWPQNRPSTLGVTLNLSGNVRRSSDGTVPVTAEMDLYSPGLPPKPSTSTALRKRTSRPRTRWFTLRPATKAQM
ncbi:hypothetical protein HPB52_001126 [Rhipicephalus sanguineus]|uniref:Uncharacterized protein n=1 Tax=Rhipicephalus sanguineus TaxID=34632 RepID=A0A9D4SR64_RHISA|nr:hypothetical protein HPB52_001126 [Rhipicephalus sanguineus]